MNIVLLKTASFLPDLIFAISAGSDIVHVYFDVDALNSDLVCCLVGEQRMWTLGITALCSVCLQENSNTARQIMIELRTYSQKDLKHHDNYYVTRTVSLSIIEYSHHHSRSPI